MPYKDPLVRNARQREKYHTNPDFRLRHYEAVRKYNKGKRQTVVYKPRPSRPQRKVGYRKMLIELLSYKDGNLCQICLAEFGVGDKVVIDHILAVADGGADEAKNIQLAHNHCNSKKESDAVYTRTINKIRSLHNVVA